VQAQHPTQALQQHRDRMQEEGHGSRRVLLLQLQLLNQLLHQPLQGSLVQGAKLLQTLRQQQQQQQHQAVQVHVRARGKAQAGPSLGEEVDSRQLAQPLQGSRVLLLLLRLVVQGPGHHILQGSSLVVALEALAAVLQGSTRLLLALGPARQQGSSLVVALEASGAAPPAVPGNLVGALQVSSLALAPGPVLRGSCSLVASGQEGSQQVLVLVAAVLEGVLGFIDVK
jgi:hypothetical protein